MSLATITQIRWPKYPCANGRFSYQLRISRNSANPEPGAANVLELDDSGCPSLLNNWLLNKQFFTSEGFKASDNVSFDILDRFDYTGTVNGIAVSENFASAYSTFLTTFFNDKTNLYTAWIYWFDKDNPQPFGAPLDVPFLGQYSATIKPQAQGPSANTQTGLEVVLGTRSVQLIAISTLLNNHNWGELTFASGDMVQQGQFYSGFAINPKVAASGAVGISLRAFGASREDAAPTFIHAAPYWTSSQDLVKVDAWNDPNVDWNGLAQSFPQGLWGITIGKLIQKIADAIGFTFSTSDTHTAFDFYRQFADNTNRCWPVETSAPIDVRNLCICWNLFAGVHPFINGETWDNPLAFKPTDTLATCLSSIANFLFVNLATIVDSTGSITFELNPYGDSQGALPADWITTTDIKESEPYTGPTTVTVNNKADTTKVVAPANTVGDTLTKEIPFRLRSWGDTAPAATLFSDNPNTIFDASLQQFDQYKCFWMGSPLTAGMSDVQLTDDCWKGLAYVYWSEGLATTTMYPTSWKNAQKIFAATDWTNSFFALGAVYKKGATPSATAEIERFSALNYYAVAGARYLIPKGTILEREYKGVVAADGTLSGVKLGLTDTWRYDGNPNFTASAINIAQNPYDGTTVITWSEDQGGAFPDIFDIPFALVAGGNSSSQGPTNSNTSILQSIVTNGSGLHTFEVRQVKFYSAGSVIETLWMSVYKWWDSTNSRWVVQFGFAPPYDPATGSTYGSNTFGSFHYKGTEHGDVEIVGISATGVPDYWFAGIDQMKLDLIGDNSYIYYALKNRYWSEDIGKFINQNNLECAHPNRRVYVQGRIKLTWAGGAGFGGSSWITLADAVAPMSDREILRASDTAPFGFDVDYPNAINPIITPGVASIEINFGPRVRPVALDCMAWKIVAAAPATTGSYELYAMPLNNERPNGIDLHRITLQFGVRNFAGPAPFIIPYAGNTILNTAMTENAATWTTYVTMWGLVEMVGEDARTR